MKLLKRKNWFIWLLLTLISGGSGTIALAVLLDCVNEDAWYMNWKNWLIGILLFLFPASIMASVFTIQMTSLVAAKLDVPGKELYLSPYIWILCIIIPVIGWIMLIVMLLYIVIWTIVSLYRGNGEKYINYEKN